MPFQPITDPVFYAFSIPAVLLLGLSKSGFGAGFGSLAVPMMALVVTVPEAAAMLMPVLLVMDLLGMAAFRKDFDAKLLRFLLPFGLLGIVVGAMLFQPKSGSWARLGGSSSGARARRKPQTWRVPWRGFATPPPRPRATRTGAQRSPKR